MSCTNVAVQGCVASFVVLFCWLCWHVAPQMLQSRVLKTCKAAYALICIGSEKTFALSSKIICGCRYPEGDLDTNLTIVITNVGADFTRLGSFGDAEQFGGTLVAQMDRSYLNRSWNKPKTPVQASHTF